MMPITSPTTAFSPLAFSTLMIVPDAGAGSSTVALSLSISTIDSSAATTSPSCFFHTPIITSVIDSPTSGTFSSIAMDHRRPEAASERVGRSAGERGAQQFILLEIVALLGTGGGAGGTLPAHA